jgi:hypothetical protein
VVAAIVVCQIWTAGHGVLYPENPLTVRLSMWPQNSFRQVPDAAEFQIRDRFVQLLPAGSRVLSDNAGLHAALIDKGIEVVPVWSPEVRFLFSVGPEEAEQKLRSLGIGSVAYYPQSLNTRYLTAASPFYAALPQRWKSYAQVPGLLVIFVPR